MGLITAIVLIVLGLLAASSIIVEKQPSAQTLIDKIVPYQGWIGIFAAFWGIWIIIHAILNIDLISYGFRPTIWWVTYLITGIVEFALGFLLGFSMISLLLSNNEKAKEKGEKLREKLAGYQVPLGIAGICLGIWTIIANFTMI